MSGTAPASRAHPAYGDDVRSGLLAAPKRLSPRYFYDDLGSALFDAITHLPEYGLTRAEERLLIAHSRAIAKATSARMVVELGSGSGRKARPVLQAIAAGAWPVYCPVDVSPAALDACAAELRELAVVVRFERDYLPGLREAVTLRRERQKLLVMFLGSNIGNFDRGECRGFLESIRRSLQPDDALLIGADLVKDRGRMIAAYDDPLGVTAAFNRNILARINRDLGGAFDLRRFQHEIRYDEGCRRIEMHLRSMCDQRVRIDALDLEIAFETDETIWTESSHKFAPEELEALGREAGYAPCEQWIDREWPFALTLFRPG